MMSCSDCSDMVRVWKKRSKKMVKYLGGKRVEVNETKIHRYQSIRGKSQSGIKKNNKKKVVQNIFGNYYFLNIVIENG